jgi:hypothetical protein
MQMQLRREIVSVLAFKLAALAALYVLFFAPPHRPPAGAESVAAHFAARPSEDLR